MARFKKRVGQVSRVDRAIQATVTAIQANREITAKDIAETQGISRRWALDILKYATLRGWLHAETAVHRTNAKVWKFRPTKITENKWLRDVHSSDILRARDLCAAYQVNLNALF